MIDIESSRTINAPTYSAHLHTSSRTSCHVILESHCRVLIIHVDPEIRDKRACTFSMTSALAVDDACDLTK
ncbi:hypothetical protein RSAG8_00205, partial [Rhizoctonia solani AG-8 WAC10335]